MMLHILLYGITLFISLVLLLHTICSFKNKTRYRLPPGPIALPIIGHLHLLETIPYKSFHKLSTRYGPLIYLRLGSVPCVVVSSLDLAKELLMANELSFTSRPVTMAMDYLTYNSSGFVFSPITPAWKFMKKVITNELLGNQALTRNQHIRRDEIQILVQLLVKKSNGGELVNVSEAVLNFTNNIITRMMLGIRYSGKRDKAEEVRTIVREVSKIFGEANLLDSFGFLRHLDFHGFVKRMSDIRRRFDALLEGIIQEREELRNNKMLSDCSDTNKLCKNFLDTLLEIAEDKNSEIKITRENIKAFLLDIIMAGTDTPAGSVEWALGEIVNHPFILEKARAEIDSVIGMNRLVDESDLPNLHYLQAIYREVLRLHPPVPLLARESTQDCKVAGYDIPAKTRLFVNLCSIQRNSQYWRDPLEFKPERFMICKSEDDQCDLKNKDIWGNHFDLMPFGTGRRRCMGISMALLEATTVLGAIIQCFQWKIVAKNGETKIDMIERPGFTVPKANPISLVLTTRLDPSILMCN